MAGDREPHEFRKAAITLLLAVVVLGFTAVCIYLWSRQG